MMRDKQIKEQEALRLLAETRLAAEPIALSSHALSTADAKYQKLLHELQVHQIELEMQNQHLRDMQVALEISRDRYLDLYEFAPVGYLSICALGQIKSINFKAASMLGVERKKLLSRPFIAYIKDSDKDVWHREFARMKSLTPDAESNFDLKLNQKNGGAIDVQLNCLRSGLEDSETILRISLSDITRRKQAEADLRIAATAFEIQLGMVVCNAHHKILRVNQAFTNITGYSEVESKGTTLALLKSKHHHADFFHDIPTQLNENGLFEGELHLQHKNGSLFIARLLIKAVHNTEGSVTNFVTSLEDITKIRVAEDKIHRLAFYDPLTNLPNRRLLLDRLHQAISSSLLTGKEIAVLILDLDHFKTLNDTHGHDFGDILLQEVAKRLTQLVREEDTVARLGGDEYVVLLTDLNSYPIEPAAQTEVIAKKILLTLNQPYLIKNKVYQCTASIGATTFNQQKCDWEDLLKQADIALFQAKKEGRNLVRFFDPKMQIAMQMRSSVEQDLYLALQQQEFVLFHQIQVNDAGKAEGAEALIRWRHPKHGLVLPMEFIPLAEESNFILSIGEWVLNAACLQLKKWEKSELTNALSLSINISAKQLHQLDFVSRTLDVIAQHGINPAMLKLELTESMIVDEVDNIILRMRALADAGIQFSLDDFGTGFSSLQQIKNLPLSQLKIDQSFVREIHQSRHDQVIVRTIIAMAQSLNLDVIAEGVETEAQLQQLKEIGCTRYQGHLLGKPCPIHEFEAKLKMRDAFTSKSI